MTQSTLFAIDKCLSIFDKIKNNELKETDLNSFFAELSKLDYRSDHEKKIDYYIDIFSKGCYEKKERDTIYITARNSERYENVRNVKKYADQLQSEHFVHVRKPFFEKYKKEYKKHLNAISPKEILNAIKKWNKRINTDSH